MRLDLVRACAVLVVAGVAGSGGAERPGPDVLGDARFERGGASVGGLHLALRAVGRRTLDDVDTDAVARRVGDEVRFDRAPGVVEWWRDTGAGLEEGVTIAERPVGDGELVLEVVAGEGVVPRGAGDTIRLEREDGTLLATYSRLTVIDADGARVPARMAAVSDHVRIEVDDAAARYPLVVDPIVAIEEAVLRTLGVGTSTRAAISGDGRAAFVRESNSSSSPASFYARGATWAGAGGTFAVDGVAIADDGFRVATLTSTSGRIYARAGTTSAWTMEGTISGSAEGITISGDGATAAAFFDTGAHVSLRTGTTWGAARTISSSFSAGGAALSDDGTRLVLWNDAPIVRFSVHARTGTSWSMEHMGDIANAPVLSGDGASIAVVQGSLVRLFVRSGTTWTETPTGITCVFPTSGSCTAVAIDATGARMAVAGRPPTGTGGDTRIFRRDGTAWSVIATIPTLLSHLSLSSRGDRLLGIRTTTGSSGEAVVFRIGADGDPCTAGTDCVSGSCTDGVCCDTPCAGGAFDCQACSVATGAAVDGTCGPLTAAAAAGVECRPAVGPCDAVETCVAGDVVCPDDARVTGGTVCRAAAGPCDRDETCDGTSTACAPDSFLPAATLCGGGGTDCTTAGACTGTSPFCGGGTPLPSSRICLPADPANRCDADDHCDGVLGVCVPTFAAATTACGEAPEGECDAPDHCSGTSADCVDTFVTGGVCRAPAGSCDVAETCSGTSPVCPTDSVLASSIVCNPSASACDPAESCDGVSATCPANVPCPVDDVGLGIADSGPGTPPVVPAGCACRTAGGAAPLTLALALAFVVAGIGARRRR